MSIGTITLRQYWQHVRKYKITFVVMIAMIPLSNILITSALPYLFSQVIGAMTAQNLTSANQLFWLTIAAGIGGVLANLIGFNAMIYHESHVTESLRNGTFASLINKDMRFFVNEKIGGLTSKYIDYIRSETTIQDLIIIRTLGFVLSLAIGISFVMTKSFWLGFVVLALVVILVFEVKFMLWIRRNWRKARRDLRSDIHGLVADTLTNQVVVKTFTGEKREYNRLAILTEKFRHFYMKDIGLAINDGTLRVALATAAQIATLGISITLLAQGKIDVATIIFSMSFLQLLGSNLFTLGELLNGFQEALLEAQPMTEMLAKQNKIVDQSDARAYDIDSPQIDFDHVDYHYDDSDELVLDDINLTIPTGQKVGLVGRSGAGKTTLSHLLLRFDDVSAGAIKIENHDVRDFTQESLRQTIGFVPQEPMLFHRSLRENIAYGRPNATDEEIEAAAKQANAWEFISALPNGIDTLVGERGVKLSGGQRQRIAIARAILKDAPILVLDEATSALDSESEKLIQDSLETLMKDRTSIVIAHRLSTIAKLDRIIVLDHGKIVEDGSHHELLKHGSIYAKLWQRQSGGFLEE